MMDALTAIDACLSEARRRPGPYVFLTGAGISAESGVPTFRGKDGYWRVGSRNYHARELATRAAFERMPLEVWSWYLERRRVCRGAAPNRAHKALAEAATALRERLLLVTQNVDGLHRRAGSPEETTYEVHGNIDFMRCSASCTGLLPVPDINRASSELARALECPRCGAACRPHVLWFDEYYDEELYRFESSLEAASTAALLVVVGTTATTNLPMRMGELAAARDTPLLVVDPEPTPFSELAAAVSAGAHLEGQAGSWVPEITRRLLAAAPAP